MSRCSQKLRGYRRLAVVLTIGLCISGCVSTFSGDEPQQLSRPGETAACEPLGRAFVAPATAAPVAPDARVSPAEPPAHSASIDVCASADEPVASSPLQSGCAVPVGTPHRLFAFEDDVEDFVPMLRKDASGLVNWNNAVILGAALGGSLAIREELDEEVRRSTAAHPERWGDGSRILGYLGEVQYQVPVILGAYGWSLRTQDPELHELSMSLISAYTLSGLGTVVIKGVSNTDRPTQEWNNGHFGFPSFHTASSFTVAAVMDEHYGPAAGVPLYALSGLIGWSRIDERDHDLSDVVFGAAFGYVVGKSVAGGHLRGDSRVRVCPYVHPSEGAPGVMLDCTY